MTDQPVELPVLDDDPKDDYWAPEPADIDLTEEEIAAGNALGERIDPEDDDDNGLTVGGEG